MTEFMKRLREKVEQEVETVRRYAGEEAPPVRTALRILQIAEEVEEELAEAWVTTTEAERITGWSIDTLQAHAKMVAEGSESVTSWLALEVRRGPDGYELRLGSIPRHPSQRRAS